MRETADPLLPKDVLAVVASSLLAPVPREQALELLAGGYCTEYDAGRLLKGDGDQSMVAFVLDGLLRVYLDSGTGRQVTVRYARAGDALGLVHVLATRTPVQLQAITRVRLWVCAGDHVRSLCGRFPKVAEAVARDCAWRVVDAMHEIVLTSFGSVRARLARHLLDLSASQQQGGKLIVRATHEHLANSIGSVREVVTRVLKELQSEKLIRASEGGITILDAAGLNEITKQPSPTR